MPIMYIILHERNSGNVVNLIAFIIQLLFKSTTMFFIAKNTQKYKKKKNNCLIAMINVYFHSSTNYKKICLL